MAQTNTALAGLRHRFEEWRRLRKHRTHIPEPLWRAAVQAAREYGIWKTARQLKVDYYTLKQRLSAAKKATSEAVRFVEVTPKVLSAGPACVLELGDREGRRLRIELRDATGVEAIAQALWSRRR